MTKTITYPSGDPLKLVVDLQAVPGLAPVQAADGKTDAQFTISQAPSGTITLQVPTATDQAAVDAVYAAHDPVPAPRAVQYARTQGVEAITRTTDATPKEVFRFPCDQLRLYRADLTISGIDAGNFVSKVMEGRFTWKRTTANAVMVGITVVSDIHDASATGWAPNAVPSGTDVVFTVAGAAGRTIDWLLAGSVAVYAPAGLAV